MLVGLALCQTAVAQDEKLGSDKKKSDRNKTERSKPKIVFPKKFECESIIVHILIKPRENRTYMITVRDRHKVFELPIQIELKGKWLEIPKKKSERKVLISLPIRLQFVSRRSSFERRCRKEMRDPKNLTPDQFREVISKIPVKQSNRDVVHTLDFVLHLPQKEIPTEGLKSEVMIIDFPGSKQDRNEASFYRFVCTESKALKLTCGTAGYFVTSEIPDYAKNSIFYRRLTQLAFQFGIISEAQRRSADKMIKDLEAQRRKEMIEAFRRKQREKKKQEAK